MMLASSISRTVRKRSFPRVLSSLSGSHVFNLSTSRPLPPGPRQRRFSSSKPSSPPNDDSRPTAAPAGTSAEESTRAPAAGLRKRPATRLARQKTKEATPKAAETIQGSAVSQLLSVPSTHHLHPHEIHMASFFSLHRPISVTAVIPPRSSSSSFSSIFKPRLAAKPRPAEVIYTISVAVDDLENAATQTDQQRSTPSSLKSPPLQTYDTFRAAVTQASHSNAEPAQPTNLDGQAPQTVNINIDELARNFWPFRPPPPPTPMPSFAMESQPEPRPVRPTHTRQITFFTARTPLHRDPTYPSRPEYVEPRNSGRQPFLDRMRERHERWEEGRVEKLREMWRAISVKRQRKLKMKKHKYKKLMRRTRNLRRRLDRL